MSTIEGKDLAFLRKIQFDGKRTERKKAGQNYVIMGSAAKKLIDSYSLDYTNGKD